MSTNPRSVWTAFFFCSVSAGLPSPQHLKMDAVNTQYVLRWNWNQTSTVAFTVQSTLDNQQNEEESYTSRCSGRSETWCDLSPYLDYSGSYVLRVRAEGRGQLSNWTLLKDSFCPDENAELGPPSEVRVEPGIASVTMSFREPMADNETKTMSFFLHRSVTFRLRYWRSDTLQEQHVKEFEATHHMVSLEARTEYCLQVQAYSEGYEKYSPYTQPQCVTTLGTIPLWQTVLTVLLVLGVVVLMTGLVYLCYKQKKKLCLHYATPSSLLVFPNNSPWVKYSTTVKEQCGSVDMATSQEPPISYPLLLEPQATDCVFVNVVATEMSDREMDENVEEEAAVVVEVSGGRGGDEVNCQDSRQDSGIESGEDSGRNNSNNPHVHKTCQRLHSDAGGSGSKLPELLNSTGPGSKLLEQCFPNVVTQNGNVVPPQFPNLQKYSLN